VIDGWTDAVSFGAAIGAGVAGGAFFAFSTFVMPALQRVDDRTGLRAMQAINVAAPNPLFMLALFGTAVACVVLGASAVTRLDETAGALQLAGSLTYLVGPVLTAAWHVPRNDALARVDPDDPGAGAAWRGYAGPWTRWNHVRTVTGIAGAVLLVLALAA
jgi:uncharacterized membrane protein